YAVLNVLSGNALQHMTVFALTIMPYITASIILQLLTQVVPRLEALKKHLHVPSAEGEPGWCRPGHLRVVAAAAAGAGRFAVRRQEPSAGLVPLPLGLTLSVSPRGVQTNPPDPPPATH